MISQGRSLLILPGPHATCLPMIAAAGIPMCLSISNSSMSSKDVTSSSSYIKHQLCKRHAATTIMIHLLTFLQSSFKRLGNLSTSKVNALSTMDLSDAKCVFNFFFSASSLPPLTWYGVIR